MISHLHNLVHVLPEEVHPEFKGINLAPKRYNYLNLRKMSNSFSDNIGDGGFASVYRAKLHSDHLVAIKIFKKSEGNGEEIINEVASIGQTSHVNIVNLIDTIYY